MIALYVGIYRIAVGLHRRSVAQRERSIACLVSMAGGTVTQIGSAIGITRTADGRGPQPPADVPAVDQRHDDDDDEDDEDDQPAVQTPHVASRLPTVLFPATTFALFGRLGASRRHDTHAYSGCRNQTTSTTKLPTLSTEVRPRFAVDKTAEQGFTVVQNEGSMSKSLSTAMMCAEKIDRAAADFSDEQASAIRRRKRDAASTVAARPEDLHDLPYFDDDDDDDRPRAETLKIADKGERIFQFKDAESSATASPSATNEERVVRFVAAPDDVAVDTTTPTHHEDVILLNTSCNGDRRLAMQPSSSTSSHLHYQQRNRYTSGFASHVWRHVVVHREGRHAESRLEKASEPDERQALLKASCPRHRG